MSRKILGYLKVGVVSATTQCKDTLWQWTKVYTRLPKALQM